MKIDLIKNYSSSIRLNKPKYGIEYEQNLYGSVSKSEDNSVNRGYYGGSFTGREKVAASFLPKIRKSIGDFAYRSLDKLSDGCNNHTVIIQNLWAMLLALGPRPLAIWVLPGKYNKKSDKAAAATHAMSSGVVGFGFASVVMYPLGQAAKYIYNSKENTGDAIVIQNNLKKLLDAKVPFKEITQDKLLEGTKIVGKKFLRLFGKFDKNTGELLKLNETLNINKVSKALNMAPDVFIFGVAKAMLTVALIPPIMKYVFGIEKSKPTQDKNSQKVGGTK